MHSHRKSCNDASARTFSALTGTNRMTNDNDIANISLKAYMRETRSVAIAVFINGVHKHKLERFTIPNGSLFVQIGPEWQNNEQLQIGNPKKSNNLVQKTGIGQKTSD